MTTDVDINSMSDEDFEALFNAEFDAPEEEDDTDAETPEDEDLQESEDDEQEDDSDDEDEEIDTETYAGDDQGEGDEPEGEGAEGGKGKSKGRGGKEESSEEAGDAAEEQDSEESGDENSDSPDPTDDLKKIFEPFKANGVEMQVKNVDEARTLMQMGANYHKKMATIKPHLKRVQTLEQNKISDDDLNLLIDIKKGDRGAIKKLLADQKVDPIDLDFDDALEYKAKDYTVSDTQFELNNVIEELKESKSFDRTIEVVGNQWDAASRNTIAENPELLRGIHDQIANGDFDVIIAEVAREKALGRLTGVSDLEAYVTTYGKMSQNTPAPAPAPKASTNRPDPRAAKKEKAKRSAGISRGGRGNTNVADVPDISRMSDDDFEKFFAKHNPTSY